MHASEEEHREKNPVHNTATPHKKEKPITKLSYKEQKQLNELPQLIESLDSEKESIEKRFCDPSYFMEQPEAYQHDQKRLHDLEHELSQAYEQWELLEEKEASFKS